MLTTSAVWKSQESNHNFSYLVDYYKVNVTCPDKAHRCSFDYLIISSPLQKEPLFRSRLNEVTTFVILTKKPNKQWCIRYMHVIARNSYVEISINIKKNFTFFKERSIGTLLLKYIIYSPVTIKKAGLSFIPGQIHLIKIHFKISLMYVYPVISQCFYEIVLQVYH